MSILISLLQSQSMFEAALHCFFSLKPRLLFALDCSGQLSSKQLNLG